MTYAYLVFAVFYLCRFVCKYINIKCRSATTHLLWAFLWMITVHASYEKRNPKIFYLKGNRKHHFSHWILSGLLKLCINHQFSHIKCMYMVRSNTFMCHGTIEPTMLVDLKLAFVLLFYKSFIHTLLTKSNRSSNWKFVPKLINFNCPYLLQDEGNYYYYIILNL